MTNPGLTLSSAEGQQIVAAINTGRRNTTPTAADMPILKWDADLALDLKKYAATVPPAWFFQLNSDNVKNGVALMSSQAFASKYPNYRYLLNDVSQKKLAHGILNNMKARVNQKPCFDYASCSTTQHTDFSSCVKIPAPTGKNCAGMTKFYPNLMDSSVSKIACVPMPYTNTTNPKQDMAYFCYGNTVENGLSNTDQPYTSGDKCTKCPAETPYCNNGLCDTPPPRPGLILTDAEGQAIADALNAGRRTTTPTAADMQKVEWDPQLAADLKTFAASVNPYWFFYTNDNTGKNGANLMTRPEFKDKYPDYYYTIHDTTQSKLPHGILGIIKFRMNQKPCFDYNNCSTTSFSGYRSCYSNPMPQGKNCNWVMQYYPWLVQSNMSKIACVPLDAHGPAAPAPQDMSFFCYGRFKAINNGLENADQPYVSGPACSACPSEAPLCDNGLCVPAQPKALKM